MFLWRCIQVVVEAISVAAVSTLSGGGFCGPPVTWRLPRSTQFSHMRSKWKLDKLSKIHSCIIQ